MDIAPRFPVVRNRNTDVNVMKEARDDIPNDVRSKPTVNRNGPLISATL